MISFLKKYKIFFIGLVLGAVCVHFMTNAINDSRTAQMSAQIESNILNSYEIVETLAQTINSGGVNTAAERVMSDCSSTERNAFESGLNRLNDGLTTTELREVDGLFSRCAPVQAVRRSVMVASLEASIQDLGRLIEQRKILSSYTELDDKYQNWLQFLESEKTMSKLSYDLVELQREIIQSLLAGTNIDSPTADDLRIRGQEIRSEMSVVSKLSKQQLASLEET